MLRMTIALVGAMLALAAADPVAAARAIRAEMDIPG